MTDELTPAGGFDFDALVGAVAGVHARMAERATRAVNVSLTLRNWLIGAYISQYELGGDDRAAYGERVIEALADRLQERGVTRADVRELRRYKRFFDAYPQIRETVTPEFAEVAPLALPEIRETASPELATPGRTLVERLSFSHLLELLKIDDALERTF